MARTPKGPRRPGRSVNGPTTAELRAMSDIQLVNGFFDDQTYRSRYWKEIMARMEHQGYTDPFIWIWDTPSEKVRLVYPRYSGRSISLLPLEDIKTPSGEVLEKELTYIYDNLAFEEADLREPEQCREFCSPEGNVRDRTERELTPPQKRMLGVIRNRYSRWVKKRSS